MMIKYKTDLSASGSQVKNGKVMDLFVLQSGRTDFGKECQHGFIFLAQHFEKVFLTQHFIE